MSFWANNFIAWNISAEQKVFTEYKAQYEVESKQWSSIPLVIDRLEIRQQRRTQGQYFQKYEIGSKVYYYNPIIII